MQKEYRKRSELHGWDKNPRNITKKGFERLLKQVQKLGQYKPILITPDGEVIGGNMRLKAYEALGIEDIWVSVVDPKDENEKLEYALSDNDRAGYYDDDLLANIMGSYEIEWGDYSVDLKEPTNLRDLLDQYNDPEEDDVPSLEETAISKPGEIYQLGRHRLMCGDSTSVEDVEKLMNGVKADMAFTDPPYNIAYEGGMNTHGQNKREGILNDKMTDEQFYSFLLQVNKRLVAFTNGPIYICMSSKELPSLKRSFEEAGGHWQSFIIWIKSTFTLSRSDYQNLYEPILYGWPADTKNHYFLDDRTQGNAIYEVRAKYNAVKDTTTIKVGTQKIVLEGKVKGVVQRSRRKTDIWEYAKPSRSDEHPTMKPVALVSEALRNSSIVGQNVLDLFGGSGSTLIAAQQLDRTCYMMELDPKYVDVIRKRYAKLIGEENQWQEVTPKI